MKIAFAWTLPVLALLGCSPPLEGDLSFEFGDDVLTIAFAATDGQSFRVGTVFAALSAHGAKMGDTETHRCVALPPDGRIQVALSEYTNDAKIDVAVTQDDPRRDPNRDPKAPLRDPRPCEGVPVVTRTWGNDTGLSKGSEVVIEDPEVEDPEVTTKAGQLAPIVVPELCATDEVELELHNVGEGVLTILSAELAEYDDEDLGDVTPSTTTIDPGERATLTVRFREPVVRATLVIDTDEPNTRPHVVMLKGTRPEMRVAQPGLSITDGVGYATFTIREAGCGRLGDVRAEILPYSPRDPEPREFSIDGCTEGEECIVSVGRNVVNYAPIDASASDLALLKLTPVDDDAQEVLVTLSGTNPGCPIPEVDPLVRTNTASVACAGEVQTIRATTRNGSIEDYGWRLYGQRGGVTVGRESTDVSFTPNKPGLYAVDLVVVNACGALAWPDAPLEIIAEDCE